MGERKIINQYYPPDFDPAKLPRGKKADLNALKVRMMLPMSIRCETCGTYMAKGTKFNTKKEDVEGETYLGIQIFRFYMRCRACSAEITFKTDPERTDYAVERGASRNYEPWKANDAAEAEAAAAVAEEEAGDAMKALENRVAASKRELDLLDAVDELRSRAARHAGVSVDAALAALAAERGGGGGGVEDDGDEAAVARMLLARAGRVKRLEGEEEERGGAGPSSAPAPAPAAAPAAAPRPAKLAVVVVRKRAPAGGDGAPLPQKPAAPESPPAPALEGLLGAYGSSSASE